MDIDSIPKQIWQDTVKGKIDSNFDFLALKILLSRLKLTVKQDSAPSVLENSVNELKNFFKKTIHIPQSRQDLQKILTKGGV